MPAAIVVKFTLGYMKTYIYSKHDFELRSSIFLSQKSEYAQR